MIKSMSRLSRLLAGVFLLSVTGCGHMPVALGQSADQTEDSTVTIRTVHGKGSGVYIGNGRILTVAHVTIDAAPGGKLGVISNKGEVVEGVVVWQDATTDTALIQVDKNSIHLGLASITCGLPDASIGQEVEIIGNPLDMQNIHTFGRIASDVAQRANIEVGQVVDATVAPGNSGGPVFDKSGEIVGLVDALPYGVISLGKRGGFPATFALTVIVPRSEVCKQLAANHPKPLFSQGDQ